MTNSTRNKIVITIAASVIIAGFVFVGFRMRHKAYPTTIKDIFTTICRTNAWKGTESVSGTGSSLDETRIIRVEIPILLKKYGIETMLDAACGDFHWMKEVDLPLKKYIGIDVVGDLIEKNKQLYANETREFLVIDVASDKLPLADLILCRDCLGHYDFATAQQIIKNFKQNGATYLLATTFPNTKINENIVGRPGYCWKPYNLQHEPFNFPAPIEILHEGLNDQKYSDKALALWRLEDL